MLVFFFLVVLVPGFIHFPYQNMIFFWASNWCSFFWWSWFLASSIYQDDATVSGDARSTLRTAQSVCCSLRCFQLTILLFSKPSLFQLHLIVFSITRFFFWVACWFRNWLIPVHSSFYPLKDWKLISGMFLLFNKPSETEKRKSLGCCVVVPIVLAQCFVLFSIYLLISWWLLNWIMGLKQIRLV